MCTFIVHCLKIEFLSSFTSALMQHFELSVLVLCAFSLLPYKWWSGEFFTVPVLFILLL